MVRYNVVNGVEMTPENRKKAQKKETKPEETKKEDTKKK